jgi:hypothetical protein
VFSAHVADPESAASAELLYLCKQRERVFNAPSLTGVLNTGL